MTPSPTKRHREGAEKRIPAWVPLLLIALFFVLILGGTRLGVRAWVVYRIWEQLDNWNQDGVLIQTTKFSCVPCSIVMLLKDEGIEASAARVAWIAGTDLKGTAPEGIKRAGKYYGFDVRETEMGFEELMEANLPAIVEFWHEGILHAVYVRPDPRNGRLVIKNPSVGLVYTQRSDVQRHFGSDRWDVFLFE
jgi:predicted double-glycine peptidase